ncbi:tetratricopeptide repeat protein [Alteromonas gilva]|uniref:Tetratricopeptide repeat protein n=1 Tax=Alteromonas gilva TaxID=2987522 RepID=A0ABT5KY01_9ALTE|nr:tetratricopeptide repeat protein [Alteromonas gilva]MDC8829517.1 tetratricopeptide repeat protein [Alteromonas gilva]
MCHQRLIILLCCALLICLPVFANADINMQLAEVTKRMAGDLDEAEELIEEVMASYPDNAAAHFLCGQIMGQQASNAIFSAMSYAGKSLDCFKKAVELAPENTDYRLGLMIYYLSAPGIAGGDTDLAWEHASAIEDLDALAGIRAKLRFYRQTENEQGYSELLHGAQRAYADHAEFHYLLGLHLQQQEQFAPALEAFNQAVAANIDEEQHFHLSALYQIGRNAVFSEQFTEQGTAALQRFIDIGPDKPNLPTVPWAHFRLAQLYKHSNNLEALTHHLALAKTSADDTLQKSIKAAFD